MRAVSAAVVARHGAVPGTVHLVGAGPGDPGLLTLRAAALLASADLVLHDQLITDEVLALVGDAELVAVGRRCGSVVMTHEEVLARMIGAARAGMRVVRLKGGDPMVFGRGGEEAQALLAAGVAVELTPGVTSAIAGAAAAGIPVTHRGVARGFLAVTAQVRDDEPGVDWAQVAGFDGTLVVMMGRARWAGISAALIAAGRRADQPAAAVVAASTAAQQVVTGTLATIATQADAAGLGTPALLVVGDVVSLRDQLAASAPQRRHGRIAPPVVVDGSVAMGAVAV